MKKTFYQLAHEALQSEELSDKVKDTLRKILALRHPQLTAESIDFKVFKALYDITNPGCDNTQPARSSELNQDEISKTDLKEVFGFSPRIINKFHLLYLLQNREELVKADLEDPLDIINFIKGKIKDGKPHCTAKQIERWRTGRTRFDFKIIEHIYKWNDKLG